MTRDQVVAALRSLEADRERIANLERAMAGLDACEREIIEKMYVRPARYACDCVCEKFDIEVASVYRRRNKALQKLARVLSGVR